MFSATDVANFLACQHTATLDRAESRKEIKKPFFDDPAIELLQKLGLEHEKQYLRHRRPATTLASMAKASRRRQACLTERPGFP
jgi:hypothetical protein